MFFILSKTLNFVTNPLVIVFGCFALSILFRSVKRKKIFFWMGLSLLFFFSNDFIANEAMRAWEIPVTPYKDIHQTYEWGIVLTGVTLNDKQPDDRVYFQHGADRVVHAVELYKKGIINRILISGGTGRLLTEGRTEADELVKVMELMEVPASAIRIENKSRNTHESAVNVKQLFTDSAATNYLLITSAFHMRRSLACFNKAGLETTAFSTDFYTHPRYFTPDILFIPKVDAILIWQKLFKEWVGIVAYWAAGYV